VIEVRFEDESSFVFLLLLSGHMTGWTKGETTDSFRNTLRRFVDQSRAANVEPILVTPMTRRKFRDGEIVTTLRPYAEAMLVVGKEKRFYFRRLPPRKAQTRRHGCHNVARPRQPNSGLRHHRTHQSSTVSS